MITVVIPAYNPPAQEFESLLEQMKEMNSDVLVVDDGSETVLAPNFSTSDSIRWLKHTKNTGKGAAIKTAVSYLINDSRTTDGILCVDADGQHHKDDIENFIAFAKANPARILVGRRSFDSSTPFKSRIGNFVASILFFLKHQTWVNDTQVGLRFIPAEYFSELLSAPGDRYEFEMQFLEIIFSKNLPATFIPIKTKYHDAQNSASHFRPILDSIRVLNVLARHILVAIASFFLDIILFSIVYFISEDVMMSTYIARIFSATLNFLSARNLVFNGSGSYRHHFLKYAVVAMLSATLSGSLLHYLSTTEFATSSMVALKILVDLGIFIINFILLRHVVFR